MKTLKLQVGKTYRNRKGEEVKIVEKYSGGKCLHKGNNGEWYTKNGSFACSFGDPSFDLIEEVPSEPTRHTFDIPDGVKKVTVEQHGNRIIVEMVPEERKEPKPGDVMINRFGSVYIFKSAVDKHSHEHYAWLGTSGRLAIDTKCDPGRPATPEEAQPLWDALKKAGKRWNSETMQVEEITEKEKIENFLESYADGVMWSREQVRCLIEDYLKHKEAKNET
jgi:hypothetical protein